MRTSGVALAVLLLAAAARPAEAAPEAPPEPEIGVYRFVADLDDAYAVFVNPAAMAGAKGTNLLMDISGGHRFPDEWSGAMQGGWAGFGYRHNQGWERCVCGGPTMKAASVARSDEWRTDSYVLAAAQGRRWLSVGAAAEWMDTDTDGVDFSTWHLSALSRLTPRVSVAGKVERLGQSHYHGEEVPARYTLGVSVRPLPSSPRFLVINVQGRHEDGGHGRIDMLYGIGAVTRNGFDVALTLRDLNGSFPELGISITRRVRNGSYTGRAHASKRDKDSEYGYDTMRGTIAVEAVDEFWRRSHPR